MKESEKGFVWYGLRIGFWVIVVSLIAGYLLNEDSSLFWFVAIIQIISIVFTFVLSIIHLVKYKPKAFAVTSLVISSICVLLLVLGFLVGFIASLSRYVRA